MEGVRQRRHDKNEYEFSFKEKELKYSKTKDSAPTWTVLVSFAIFLLVLKLILLKHTALPNMLTIHDEANYPDSFIGERARNSLFKLQSIGPKLTGSYECEVTAVRVLREEVAEISRSANKVHLLQEDLQRPKGSFPLALKPHGFNSVYENIQNFAVRIGPRVPSNHSVLVNCHFDTVPDSPGASDNGLNCAVMIEILRKLSQRKEPLKNNVIFLFNGAEEQMLQGAHGFITSHHWHKEVRAVVNLDSGGAGGREAFFQSTHPWITQLYARTVPHPHASVAFQEIFESGLVPSDTDFRIFRDFAHLPGIDLAHGDNGYIYHTRLDTMDFIEPGVYQNTGDNVLALLLQLSVAREVDAPDDVKETGPRLVYFDLFNSVMITYTDATGIVFNIIVAVLNIYCAISGLASYQKDSTVLGGIVCAFLTACAGLSGIVAVVFFLDWAGASLSWYPRPYLIIPLYVFPYVAASLKAWPAFSKSLGFESALRYYFGGQVLTSGILLILTLCGIRTSYLVMLVLLPAAVIGLLTSNVKSPKLRLYLLTLSSFLGTSVFLKGILLLYIVLVPVAGRAGVLKNPEIIIGAFTFFSCFIVGNALIPLMACVKNPHLAARGFALLSIVTIALVLLTPLGFPYSANPKSPALQRFYIYHTQQNQYGADGVMVHNESVVFILPMDRNGMKYVREEIPLLRKATPANCHPDRLFCLFPLYNSRFVDPAKTSVWVPFTPPYLQYPTKLNLKEIENIGSSRRRLKFQLQGPDHIAVIMSPRSGISLTNWTLNHHVQAVHFENRQYYIVFISDGMFGNSINFDLNLENGREGRASEGAWVDIMVVGHYQHQKATYTPEFAELVSQFPDWTQATAWLSSVQAYSF